MASKHALLVGINQYGKDSGLAPLRYAEDDARALAEALRRDCGFETETLLGAAATGIAIQERIEALPGGELFVFFFAGHGQMVQGQFCLHTAESRASGVGALPYVGLSRWWRYNFGFGQVLAVLDACRNEYNWTTRGARGFAASRDIELSMTGESLVEVLYGCSDGEVSYEEEDLGHGVFTSALLRVLRDDAGEVDSGTLAARANDLMAEWCRRSGKRQKAKRYYEPSERHRIVLRPGAAKPEAGGASASSSEPVVVVPPPPEMLECPLCGKRNRETETFRCRECGRDNLCLRHQDGQSFLCASCEGERRKEEPPPEPRTSKGPMWVLFEKVWVLLFWALLGVMVNVAVEQVKKWSADSPPDDVTPQAQLESTKTVTLPGGVKLDFVLVPAGTFQMGCTSSKEDCDSDEEPRHKVTISHPFYLGEYEVTQAQWQAVMGSNPSGFKGENRPVEKVSWEDVQEFIGKLNVKEGHNRYRLPTEAEWEYAARAGSRTAYSFGDDAGRLGEYAWYGDNSGKKTHPVRQKRPNAWGLYDMHGNVWEWVQDRYSGRYYTAAAVVDPQGPNAGEKRVLRGGGWSGEAGGSCRVANRVGVKPSSRYGDVGFRIALSPGH